MSDVIAQMRRSLAKENFFYVAFFVVVCVSPLIAIFLPERALTRWGWAIGFTEFIASIIPSIDRLAASSQFPDVTRLFMALEWSIWGPLCAWLTVRFGNPNERNMIDALNFIQARWWWFVFFLLPFGAVLVWILVFLPFPNLGRGNTPFDYLVQWMGVSLFGLGIGGSLLVTCTVVIALFILNSYSVIRLAYRVRKSAEYWRNKERR